jgi:hypothetical protein
MYVNRNGLLVPADTRPALTPEAAQLHAELAAQRNLDRIAREDEAARRAGRAHFRNRLADITEKARAARRARRDRKRDAREQADLNRLYRVALRSGTRARIRADIQRSAEMRALRVNRVRTVTLAVGLPILAGFGAWSTAGAQAGTVRLANLQPETFAWNASWGVEPALIAIVAGIIIGKAVLRASGGDTDWKASFFEWAALGASLGLNVIGGWVGGWAGFATVLPHMIGPLGCAATAALIGMFVKYAADARPWDGAPRLEELGFVAPNDAPITAAATVTDAATEDPGDALAALADAAAPAAVDAELTQPDDTVDAGCDASVTRPRNTRRTGPVARRVKAASPATTSGDARDADPATKAAHLVLTRRISNREAARQVGGTSEASVRRRVEKLRAEYATDAANNDAESEPGGRDAVAPPVLPMLPLPTSKPAVTHGVNGHHPTPEETR